MRRSAALLALIFVGTGATAFAQDNPVPRALRPVLDSIRVHNEWTLAQQQSICEIPAPPFKERDRALELQRRFQSLGLAAVRIDAEGNVIAERAGRNRRPLVVLSAHLDTVFPESTDVRVQREGTHMKGPGIADDCRGLAVLLVIARSLQETRLSTEGSLLFVGTVGEEGVGNSRGARHLVEKEFPGEIDFFLTVDLDGFDIANQAVGSIRYQVTYAGPGGHSFNAFGMPNPIHAAGRLIAAVSEFQVPTDPPTTFNVGVIRGGKTVNAIADSVSMAVDLRSSSPAELQRLDREFLDAASRALEAERARWPASRVPLAMRIDTLGMRPAGSVADTAPIIRAALLAGAMLHVTPTLSPHSTDANFPSAMGIPAIAVGHGGQGEGEHSLAESYSDGERGYLGPQWVTLTATALAGRP